MNAPTRAKLASLACAGLVAGSALCASAQDRGRARREAAAPAAVAEEADESDEATPGLAAESEVVEGKGGKRVTVIRFSGLDISGQLKSPQLLYFLNRLRAEFDRPRLPHRSFLPELRRSARGDSF